MDDKPFSFCGETDQPEELQHSVEPASLDTDPISVLIIEDEEAHFELMKRAIRKELPATSVRHMNSAAACLEGLDHINPDVILVDYLMPGMNGIEFLSALKQMGSDIPVIMITGQGDESIAVQAMKLGAQDYLVKNADFFSLLPAVIGQVARERRLALDLRKVARLNALLLDSLPYPAMMIRWDRLVLAANRIAQKMGARVGRYCWQNFRLGQNCPQCEDGECPFCRAGDAFQLSEAINSPELAVNSRIWDVWWIPIDREVCLHYAIDITERKRAEYSLRILSRFVEIANRHADMSSLLQAFVHELKSVTGCSEVAVWVSSSEGGEPFVAREGCDLRRLTDDPARIRACGAPAEGRANDRPGPLPGITSTDSADPVTAAASTPTAPEQSRHSGRPSGASSTAWIPVRLEERVLGAIYLAGHEEGLLPPDTIDIVDTAAMKLAAAVERILSRERLEKSERTLRFLSKRLMSAHEEERTRISRELHDSIGSSLCAIRLSIENIMQGELELRSLEEAVSLTQDTMEEVRRIMSDLRPAILDDLGIIAALSWFCRKFKGLHPGINVTRQIDIREDEIPEPLKIVIFRFVQESFNNVVKYSQADAVTLSLARKAGAIHLAVHDNGSGFDPMSITPGKGFGSGIGLTSMQERTELSGGTFSLASRKGEGTRVAACWPLLQD